MSFELGGQTIPLEFQVEVLLLCVGLVGVYFGLIRNYGLALHPDPAQPPATTRQRASFLSGVALLWLASGSPLHTLADGYLFSAHMVQHLLQAFVLAPLFLMGIPGWMLEIITRPRPVRATIRTLGRPLVAGLTFNVVLLGIHWPLIITAMVNSSAVHLTMHTALVLSSLLMWLPILSNSDAVQPRMGPIARLGYLFGMTILPTVPASFLTFAPPDRPLYPVYGQFPRLWDLPVGEDMLIAGLLMKSGAGFLLWGIIATMFFRWAASEERREQQERRELATTGSR